MDFKKQSSSPASWGGGGGQKTNKLTVVSEKYLETK